MKKQNNKNPPDDRRVKPSRHVKIWEGFSDSTVFIAVTITGVISVLAGGIVTWRLIHMGWEFLRAVVGGYFTAGILSFPIYFCLKRLMCLVSYPFRYRRVARFLNEPCSEGNRLGHHDWDGCVCKRCGKTRHDWETRTLEATVPGHNTCEEITTTTTCEICRNCGVTRAD